MERRSHKKSKFGAKRASKASWRSPHSRTSSRSWTSRRFTATKIPCQIMPRTQLVQIKNEISGYIPAAKVANAYFATIYAAQLGAPFNTGSPLNAANFGTMILTSGAGLGNNFTGYTSVNQFYAAYKVYSAKLTVVCRPEGSTDTIEVIAFPFALNNADPLNAMNANQWMNQPMARRRTCYNSNTGHDNTLELAVSASDVLGCTKDQYKYSITNMASLTSAPENQLNFQFWLAWQQLDNTNLGQNVTFEITLERVVQFFNPNNQS